MGCKELLVAILLMSIVHIKVQSAHSISTLPQNRGGGQAQNGCVHLEALVAVLSNQNKMLTARVADLERVLDHVTSLLVGTENSFEEVSDFSGYSDGQVKEGYSSVRFPGGLDQAFSFLWVNQQLMAHRIEFLERKASQRTPCHSNSFSSDDELSSVFLDSPRLNSVRSLFDQQPSVFRSQSANSIFPNRFS